MAQNVDVQVTGDKLIVTVDLSKDFGPSKSGKTILIASTQGNVDVPRHEGVKLGVNVYRGR